MKHTKVKALLESSKVGEKVIVKGWVRAFRSNRFIQINDGSTINNIQAVIEYENFDEAIILGEANPDDVQKTVMQPKKHSLEFLREQAHLRFRTNTFGAVFRIRHGLTFAIHKFFNDKGFYNLHTPIITSSDAEGAGEMFHVTHLDLNQIGRASCRER